MKNLICLSAWLLSTLILYPASITLAFKSNSKNVAGYIVRYGSYESGVSSSVDVGNVNTYEMTTIIENKKYWFYVTAYDKDRNESEKSELLEYTLVNKPKEIKLAKPVISIIKK